ncbi:hypothetical protein ACTMU2_17225 [Cupriavidus basilensis]
MQTLTEADMRPPPKAIVRAVAAISTSRILSMLPWVRRQLVAERYGSRRVFLAGTLPTSPHRPAASA